jgi:outer membrane protein insertion porin family
MAHRLLSRSVLAALAVLTLFPVAARAQVLRRVREVVFEGSNAFTAKQLRKVVNIENRNHFLLLFSSAPRFNYLVLGRDVTYLRAYYRNRGYLQVRVEDQVEQVSDEDLVVHFQIEEGPLTTLSRVRFEGNTLLTETELTGVLRRVDGPRLRADRGDPLNEAAIQFASGALLQRYRTEGRYFAVIEPSIGVRDSLNGSAPVTFRIHEGPVVRVGRLTVEGNRITREPVIEREVTLKPGDVISETARRESQRRLYGTGIFRTVNVTLGEVSADSTTANMLVAVSEQAPRYAGTGIGVGNDPLLQVDMLLRGSAEWGHRNILGTGRSLRFNAAADFQVITDWRQIRRELGLRYTEPWFFGTRTPLTAALTVQPLTYKNYQVQEVVTELGLRREFSPTARGWINFNYRLVNTRIPIEAFKGRAALRGFSWYLDRDARDSILSPSRGSITRLSGSLYGVAGLGGPQYGLFTLSWGRYQAVAGRTILASRIHLGAGQPMGPTAEIPIVDRFFLGGANTVRGYPEQGLGPVVSGIDSTTGRTIFQPRGGQAMALFNIALRRPRIVGPLGLLAFFDAGNVWPGLRHLDTRLAFSAGVGVFLDTPVGPVRVDHGWRLNRSSAERDNPGYRLRWSRWHFSILYAF